MSAEPSHPALGERGRRVGLRQMPLRGELADQAVLAELGDLGGDQRDVGRVLVEVEAEEIGRRIDIGDLEFSGIGDGAERGLGVLGEASGGAPGEELLGDVGAFRVGLDGQRLLAPFANWAASACARIS